MRGHAALLSFIAIAALVNSSWGDASDRIVEQWRTNRSSAMGGVFVTTGLWDQNFHGNPARVTANPHSKLNIFNFLFDGSPAGYQLLGQLLTSSLPQDETDILNQFAGQTVSTKLQFSLFDFYLKGDRVSWAFGFLNSLQQEMSVRQNTTTDFNTIIDTGPALTFGIKLLRNKELSIGTTVHYTHRITANQGYGLVSLLKNQAFSPSLGEGGHLDFNLGATYELPWDIAKFDLIVGISVNNVIGGFYNQLRIGELDGNCAQPGGICLPDRQYRSYALGISMARPVWWQLRNVTFALELNNMANNVNGSFFRLLKMGGEATWREHFKARLGLHQGYITAGLGIDFRVFEINLATYGEEMALNVGKWQNRVYSLHFSLGI